MRLIMAVSKDGFVSKGDGDRMTWTGPADKLAFKTLTMVGGKPLGAGRKTFELLPKLQGRSVVSISRDPELGCTLESFDRQYPDAWLIGGQETALAAIAAGLVTEFFLCRSPNVAFKGVCADLRLINFGAVAAEFYFDRATIEVRR